MLRNTEVSLAKNKKVPKYASPDVPPEEVHFKDFLKLAPIFFLANALFVVGGGGGGGGYITPLSLLTRQSSCSITPVTLWRRQPPPPYLDIASPHCFWMTVMLAYRNSLLLRTAC